MKRFSDHLTKIWSDYLKMNLASLYAALVSIFVSLRAQYVYKLTKTDIHDLVDEHNHLRQKAPASYVQKMVWDPDLAELAARRARRCLAAHTPYHQRSNLYGYDTVGENIWWSNERSFITGFRTVIRSFHKEIQNYDYKGRKCRTRRMCGHYTQVMWSTSCSVGCALASCNRIHMSTLIPRGHLLVCFYGPAGNYPGGFVFRKGPRCASCSKSCTADGLCEPTHPRCRHFYSSQVNVTMNRNHLMMSGKCRNLHVNCQLWADLDECTGNPQYMMNNCYSACNSHECNSRQ